MFKYLLEYLVDFLGVFLQGKSCHENKELEIEELADYES